MGDAGRSRPRLTARRVRGAALRLYVALAFAFLMLPVAVVVLASLTSTAYLTIPPKGLTLRWYGNVLADRGYLDAIAFSTTLALACTAGALLIGTAAAYGLVRRPVRGAATVSALLMSPLAFPGIVIGVAILQMVSAMGWSVGFGGLFLAHLVITIPYVVRAVIGNLQGTDPTLEDAARVLGATRWQAFATTTLPLIRPGVAAGGLFAFITSFDNVPVSIFLLGARETTLPVKIFTSIEYGVDPSIAAISTILIAATAVVVVVAERWTGLNGLAPQR